MAIDHQEGQSSRSARTSRWAVLTTALVFFIASWYTSEAPLVLLAVPLLAWLFITSIRSPIPPPPPELVLGAAIALLVYDMINPRITGQGQPDRDLVDQYARLMNLVWIVVAATLMVWIRRGRKLRTSWTVTIVAVAAVLGIGTILATPEPDIDVWHLHQQAGNALFSGANPYADLEVRSSFDTDDDSQLMTGYAYTPPNLVVFGSSAVATGDARWFSLACWIGFLALFARLRPRNETAAPLLVFVASQPAWHIMLEISYTESVTVLCLAGALVAWRYREWLGATLLGLALATKQYLVVLTPMVLGARLLPVRSRITAIAVAAVAVGIGVIWGLPEYLDAVVGLHLRVPPQDNSVNLYGIFALMGETFVLPAAIGLLASIGVGLWSARTARTSSQLLVGAAAALGIGFFLATQAFVNYWFLVGVLLTLALLMAEPDTTESLPTPESHEASTAEPTVGTDSR